jgi:hypothetical protein
VLSEYRTRPGREEAAMRFFTPELLARFGSDDPQIAQAAQEELERRSEEYLDLLRSLQPRLPDRFRDLLDRFYLHDARVLDESTFIEAISHQFGRTLWGGLRSERVSSLGRESPLQSFWLHLQLDTPPRETLVLQYRSARIEKVEVHESLHEESPDLEWQYDEVEVIQADTMFEFRHSILFTMGLELRLRFQGFDFATLKPMDPAEELAELNALRPLA